MLKKVLGGFLGLTCLCLPLTQVDAESTNLSLTLTGGQTGIASPWFESGITMSAKIESGSEGRIQIPINEATILGVMDFSGTHSGWKVSISSSDFVNKTNGTKFSEHRASLNVNCGYAPIQTFPSNGIEFPESIVCKDSYTPLSITSSGITTPLTLLSAPADKTSAGSFVYYLPEEFLEFDIDATIPVGTYEGEIIFDFSKTP